MAGAGQLVGRGIAGCTEAEVAGRLGVSQQAVGKRKRAILGALRGRLEISTSSDH